MFVSLRMFGLRKIAIFGLKRKGGRVLGGAVRWAIIYCVRYMRIIDIHTHPAFEGKQYDRGSIDRTVAYGRSFGVERMVVLGDVLRYGRLPTAEQVQSINNKTIELLQWHPEYFIGFCFVNPMLGRTFVEEETERCIVEYGFRGIKLEISNNARDACMETSDGAGAEARCHRPAAFSRSDHHSAT